MPCHGILVHVYGHKASHAMSAPLSLASMDMELIHAMFPVASHANSFWLPATPTIPGCHIRKLAKLFRHANTLTPFGEFLSEIRKKVVGKYRAQRNPLVIVPTGVAAQPFLNLAKQSS